MSVERRRIDEEFAEEEASLWSITFGPLVWTAHFAASYAATAVFCARWPGAEARIDLLRAGIGVATLLALAAIAWIGRRAWRRWSRGNEDAFDDDGDHDEDRHQFLGQTAFLLSMISFIGVAYVALPALLAGTCR